jgi:hypothetical protein
VGRHENASDVNASRNARVKPRKRTKPSNQLRCAFGYALSTPNDFGHVRPARSGNKFHSTKRQPMNISGFSRAAIPLL